MSQHAFKPETTNGGRCFADCTCGWSGGVHYDRPTARRAWQAHLDNTTPPEPIPTGFELGRQILAARSEESQ